jgi:hypothetical protein
LVAGVASLRDEEHTHPDAPLEERADEVEWGKSLRRRGFEIANRLLEIFVLDLEVMRSLGVELA